MRAALDSSKRTIHVGCCADRCVLTVRRGTARLDLSLRLRRRIRDHWEFPHSSNSTNSMRFLTRLAILALWAPVARSHGQNAIPKPTFGPLDGLVGTWV